MQSCGGPVARRLPGCAYFSLRLRHILLYDPMVASSSKLLHQLHQLDQVLIAKTASVAGHRHKRVWYHDRGPACGDGVQTPLGIVEIDPVFTPVVAIGDQLELLTFQRVVRMNYLEGRIRKFT